MKTVLNLIFLAYFSSIFGIGIKDKHYLTTPFFEWVTFENKEGRFSIKFPVQPILEQVNQRLNGQNITRYLFSAHGDLESYQISYYDLPANKEMMEVVNKNIDTYYDIIAKSTASEINGQLVSQSRFVYEKYVGREMKIDGIVMQQKVKHVIRVILINGRQYTLWFSTKPDLYRLDLMYVFFKSFKTL